MTVARHPDRRSEAPDDLTVTVLTAERDFLLRSLIDLDAEHAAGELSDERYDDLRDRYTVQAATVMRALERLEHSPLPTRERRDVRRRRIPVAIGLLLASVTLVAGAVLVRSSRGRQPGQTITGNAQATQTDLAGFARAARARPDDADAQLAYASALMEAGKLVDALKAFDDAARLNPANPVPKAYGGWIVFLAGLPEQALGRLDAAVAADPTYPDARFFRGMVLLRGRQDQAAALADFSEYLKLAGAGAERDQVAALVSTLQDSSRSTTTRP